MLMNPHDAQLCLVIARPTEVAGPPCIQRHLQLYPVVLLNGPSKAKKDLEKGVIECVAL